MQGGEAECGVNFSVIKRCRQFASGKLIRTDFLPPFPSRFSSFASVASF